MRAATIVGTAIIVICASLSPAHSIDVKRSPTGPSSTDQKLAPIEQPSGECARALIESSLLGEPTSNRNATFDVDCNVVLKPNDVVKRRILFEGPDDSGRTLDCNGATLDGTAEKFDWKDILEVRSTPGSWKRPQNITIKRCNIIGSVRIFGRCPNSDCENLKESSSRPGHTQRMRDSAPRNITLDTVKITGIGRNPLYLGPGVSFSTVINSEIMGASDRVGIYLDAESYRNTLDRNSIHVRTRSSKWYGRRSEPLVALDGSSYNRIINNRFSNLSRGGIYLYRNCGFEGVSRHATPSYNQIINNIFYYNKDRGDNRAIHIGAHDGLDYRTVPVIGSCTEDDGNDFGSGDSDRDHAQNNVVMQNQVYARPPNDVIEIGRGPSARDDVATWGSTFRFHLPVYIRYNSTVSEKTVDRRRLAGCFTEADQSFVRHKQIRGVTYRSGGRVCTRQDICNNNVMERGPVECGKLSEVPFSCKADGRNAGCATIARCPRGEKIVASKAICNLENSRVSDSILANVGNNTLFVVEHSDKISDGACRIGVNSASSGSAAIRSVSGSSRIRVGCKERDKNGGDCIIRGYLYCR